MLLSSDFGESRVKTASKQAQLQDLPDITWHWKFAKQQSEKSLRTISVDSLIRQFEISAAD